MTATQLRKDIYSVIDRVARTGAPVEITCKGTAVLIIPKAARSRLAHLKKRRVLKCKPEDILTADWTGSWEPLI